MEGQGNSDIGEKKRSGEAAYGEGDARQEGAIEDSGQDGRERTRGESSRTELPFEEEMLEGLDAGSVEDEQSPKGAAIDNGLIANLGSGNNDYGLLSELVPEIDFGAIPLTAPKRVNAKRVHRAKDAGRESEAEASPSRRLERTKKPASLLDSYFKGL